MVARAYGLPLVRAERCQHGLDVRHDGAAVVQPGAQAGHQGTAGRGGKQRDHRSTGGVGDVDLHDRVGHRRRVFRRAGGSHRARQDDDDNDSELHRVHRVERAVEQRVDLQRVPLSVRARGGRAVRGGRGPGGGSGAARARAVRSGLRAGDFGGGQYDRRADRDSGRHPGGGGHDYGGLALGVSGGRASRAAGVRRVSRN